MGGLAGDVPQNAGELPMINYLKHDQIDQQRWNDCIAHAPNGLVYAWSWYLDIVHPGWEALVEIVDDKYLNVMPLTCNRKYGINYLFQPFFVQQLGVFSRQHVTLETTLRFLKAIPRKFRLVEIRLNEGNPLPEGQKRVDYHQNHWLDLNHDYDTLLANYHDNNKRNLKKSLSNDLRLVKQVPIETIITLFRENRGATVTHWGDPEYDRLKRLAARALSSSNAFVYGVESSENQTIICGALFMISHGRITFLFSGNNALGKERHAMVFLLDQVIREFAGQPLILDFEGSDDENLARFYHGFGSHRVFYPGYTFRFF